MYMSFKLISYASKSVQICFGNFREHFYPKKHFFNKIWANLAIQNTRFKELLKKLNFEGFSWNWKNFKTLILQACISVSMVIYDSKSVHYYPRTTPEAMGSYGYTYFVSIRVKLDTHV